ncbi:AraC family transcriptional regulator [Thalassospira sp.]|uniref:AraC family transcriptional regulator n=1 Tax=Thalassospira sp. TaxID=1912094 RepID=UPI003AA8A0CF
MQNYLERFRRVMRYIDDHLAENLNGEKLGTVAACSRFHFHRQFSALFGINPGRYIQLARFERATRQLAYRPHVSVFDIALDCGFDSPESFSRAFKKLHGQSPSDFRKNPQWDVCSSIYQPLIDTRSKTMPDNIPTPAIEIINFPQTRVATLRHRGDPAHIGNSIRPFIDWRKRNHLPPHKNATFNIIHTNPEETPVADFVLDLCVATSIAISPNPEGVFEQIMPANRCARIRHIGPDQELNRSIIPVYAQWMPQTGELAGDYPLFFQRIAFFPDVPRHEAVTDIYVPLTTPRQDAP